MSYRTLVKSSSSAFRALPNTDTLLQSAELSKVIDIHGRNAVKAAIREELEYLRAEISDNNSTVINQVLQGKFFGIICGDIVSRLESIAGNTLIPVINLTGTVIHTNLGRARLPEKAVAAMSLVANNPSNLEYDLVDKLEQHTHTNPMVGGQKGCAHPDSNVSRLPSQTVSQACACEETP